MENQFFCQLCSKQYKDNNLPRILTMCGHTYCQICISKMITSNISEQQADKGNIFLIQCPEDGASMKLTVKQLSVFPKNLALLKVMQNKKNNSSFKDESFNLSKIVKQQQLQQDDQTTQLISAMTQRKQLSEKKDTEVEVQQFSNEKEQQQQLIQQNTQIKKQETPHKKQEDQLCLLHQKSLQIVCIVCKQKICSKCAIFGQHKGHQFKTIQQVQKQRNQCYQQILGIFKQKQQIEQRMSNNQTQTALIQILNKKRDILQKQVRDQYRKLRQQITKQQKIVLKKLNDTYKTNQTKIKGLLKVEQNTLKQFANWQIQSFQFLKILENPDLQKRVQALYSKQQTDKTVKLKGNMILNQIKEQEGNLVPNVEQILVHLKCKKSKKIFQFIPEFVDVSDKVQEDKKIETKLNVPSQKPKNMAVSTLIVQSSQNVYKQKTQNSNCTIFDEFNQKNNMLEGSPLLQQSLLDVQQSTNFGGSNSELQTSIHTFNHQFQSRVPLRPNQNFINKNHHQDSISCSFTHLELQSAKKMHQKTIQKRNLNDQDDFFQNQRSSIIFTSRPSILSKNANNSNGQRPNKKKLKSIKISQKYQKILQGIYNNSLDTIDLTNAQVGDQIMFQICQFVKYSKARTIKFIRNKLTDGGIQKIIPSLTNVQILNLSQNNLTESVLDIIIKHRNGYLSGLKNLILSQNKIIQRKHKAKIDQLRALNVVVSV